MSWFFECGQQNNKRNCLRNTANFLGIHYFFVWFFWLKKTRENSNLILIFLHNWVFFDSILTPLLNTAPMCFWILVKQLLKYLEALRSFLGSVSNYWIYGEMSRPLGDRRIFFWGPQSCSPASPKPRLRLSQACQAHGFENFQVFLSCVLKKLPNEVTFFRKLEGDKISKARWRDRNW